MQKINTFLKESNGSIVVLIFLAIKIILMIIFPHLEEWGVPNIHFNPTLDERNIGFITMLISAVIIAPIAETALFQALPLLLLTRIPYLREKPGWIILISALVFGLWHPYSIHYMVFAFIGGAVYMYVYIIRYGKYSFRTVLVIHLLGNLFATLGNEFFPI